MKRLDEIMNKLSEIDFGMESLYMLLKSFEEFYELKDEYEMKKGVWIFKMVLESMLDDLRDSIAELDKFILDNKNN